MRVEFSSRMKIIRWADRVFDYSKKGTARPIHLGLHITNRCPHDCPNCNGGRIAFPGAELDKEVAIKVATDARFMGVRAVTFGGGGEPLAHRDFAEILSRIADLGMDIGIVTNGAILRFKDAEIIGMKCDWIRVSLDAGSEERYKSIHGDSADFQATLRNLKILANIPNRKATVGVGYLTSEDTADEMLLAAKIVEESGADYIMFRPYDGDDYDASEIIIEAARRVKRKGFQVTGLYERIQSPERSYTRCHGMHFIIEVTPTGDVYPCCHWKNQGKLAYGNVLRNSLRDILNSPGFEKISQMNVRKICPVACRNHNLNETIECLFMQPIAHEAFI